VSVLHRILNLRFGRCEALGGRLGGLGTAAAKAGFEGRDRRRGKEEENRGKGRGLERSSRSELEDTLQLDVEDAAERVESGERGEGGSVATKGVSTGTSRSGACVIAVPPHVSV
jgi:hypothetical protein